MKITSSELDKRIAEIMCQSPGKTYGEALAEATGGVNLVEGKQTWEYTTGSKHDLNTMKKCCETELETWEKTGLFPAPYYFERVAILSRKEKNYAQEIEYCEKYINAVKEHNRKNGVKHNEKTMGPRELSIHRRLPKAKELLLKSQKG